MDRLEYRQQSTLQSGDRIGSFVADGYGDTGWDDGPEIQFHAEENWIGGTRGASISFRTIAIGASGTTLAIKIDHNGDVGIGTTSPQGKLDVNAIALR